MKDFERALDLTWVTPQLAIGGRFPMEAAAHLAQALGIGCVVDMRLEDCDDERVLGAHGISLLHLPTPDTRAATQPMLDEGVAWVAARMAEGKRVYVHCEHGVGRSALLGLCVLVASGDAPLDALERAKSRRWQVSPSPAQLEAFREFCRRWGSAHGARWEVPSLHELGRIAYRHLQAGSTPHT